MAPDHIPQDKKNSVDSSTFIGEAAHKIKGPLTTIRLYSESLVSGNVGVMTPEQIEYVKEIQDASHRLISIIKELELQVQEAQEKN